MGKLTSGDILRHYVESHADIIAVSCFLFNVMD